MTLLQALQKVRDIIDIDPFWDDTVIKKWLNDGYLGFFVKRGIEEQWEADVYDQSIVPVPNDIFKLFGIWYKPEGQTNRQLIDESNYRIYDNFIRFAFPLRGTIYIEGERRPQPIGDTGSFELPETLQIGIINYAIAQAFMKDEDLTSANNYMLLYLQKVKEWEKTPTLRQSRFVDNWYRG